MMKDSKEANRVYWSEILFRTHIAACTSILRLYRWWCALDHCIGSQNYLGFAGSLRAFFEASADTFYTLRNVPLTLARDSSHIKEALAGVAQHMLVNKALEDSLLLLLACFRKRYAGVGPKQKPLSTSKYLEGLQAPEYANLRACYEELCEAVHPAADSVMLFINPLNLTGSRIELAPTQDEEHILHIVRDYSDGISHAWEIGFNMPLLSLKVLERLGPGNLRVDLIAGLPLDDLPIWKKIKDELEGVSYERH